MVQQLENKQTYKGRNYRNRNKIKKLSFFGMFASLEHKPYTQKIIGDDSATRRENIAKRIFNSIKIILLCKDFWQVNTQYFEAPDFYNGTQSARNNEEDDLFLTKN